MSNLTAESDSKTIAAISRAFALLDLLGKNQSCGVTELAMMTGMNKTMVFRQLHTLQELGLVQQQADERYKLTMKLFEMGARALGSLDIVSIAGEHMKQLAELTGETVHLAMMDDASIVYLHKIPARHGLQLVSRIGLRVPVHCTAIGKIIAAHLPGNDGMNLPGAEPFQRFTDNTICTHQHWQEELVHVRKQGYAVDNEEHELGVRCFAAPVFNHLKQPVAGVSVSFPIIRIDEGKLPVVLDKLQSVAAGVSAELGFCAT